MLQLAQYSSLPSLALWVVFGPVCSALLVWFVVTRPGVYVQHRTLFLVFLKLGRIYALALTFLPHEDELSPFPEKRLAMVMTSFQRVSGARRRKAAGPAAKRGLFGQLIAAIRAVC